MKPSPLRKYTCSDYRAEMRLMALKRQLEKPGLTEAERLRLKREVQRLEESLAMD